VKSDEPLSIIRQLELMRDLQRLANDRWQEENRIEITLDEGLRAAESARDAASREIELRHAAARETARAEFETTRGSAERQYQAERDSAQQQYKGLRHEVESEHTRVLHAAVTEQQEASWETLAVFDAIKGRPRERLLEAMRRLRVGSEQLAVLEHDAEAIMRMRRQWREFPAIGADLQENGEATGQGFTATSTGAAANDGDAAEAALSNVDRLAVNVRETAQALYEQRLPRLFEGGNLLGVFFVAWLTAIAPSGFLLGWQTWWWPVASFVVAAVITCGIAAWLYPLARQTSTEQFQKVRRTLAAARGAIDRALEEAQTRARLEAGAIVSQKNLELATVGEKLQSTLSQKDRWKEAEMASAGSVFPSRLAQLRDVLERVLSSAERQYSHALAELADERESELNETQRQFEGESRKLRTEGDQDWEAMAHRWLAGFQGIRDSWSSIQAQSDRLFPDWAGTDERTWPRPTETPSAIRFGQVTLDLTNVKHGLPKDERLRPTRPATQLPALMTLKEHPVMVITAEEEGRRAAIDVLQVMMLRFLTAMPPGKVRFTILDPVGLGESFASFMHLADFDELLIASRIWTESKQIEEQLGRLTAHMETVLQKYLRNEFATIDEYNAAAGEVAEPFQVLVAANFPTNFSEAAARKLISIGASGPRCGVYTLLSVDRKLRLPNDVHLDDLRAAAVNLDWQPSERRFRWRYPAFEHLPLALDGPPSPERFNEVVRAAGRAAKDSMRVEVPFEVVAPANGELWKADSSQELVVPIGRAGAMRLQSVRLGRGTSQHLLVCGKTGSGKSTFLHALVTNAALHYSPDQVEFYLIDFKKGVEFKTYASHHLPHARVTAIESEREFGLSVLNRLDGELRRRGELFRTAGVQDLAGYREARPAEVMPRSLLVVDEFQELFVEDDKLAQESSLLLDRLVRQGRAFGIHVLLGSQTLGGAYSLARSTLGQMAVRVALQCSEADAHLILSDERNTSARYLSRPGEAIYNDQNGLVTGNEPFQVVWLSEGKRVEYLRQVEQFAAAQHRPPPQTIVFEGDQAADPADNRQLCDALRSKPDAIPSIQRAWLGAAVAIKEPTFAAFARHAGSNLLVVGGEDESALGVTANAVIALTAQNPQNDAAAKFLVLDGTRAESVQSGAWQQISVALAGQMTVAGPRETAEIVHQVAAEVARRETAQQEDAPPWYLVIYNGGRLRDLRRSDDNYGFSIDRDKPPRPDREWGEILRNGPAWGIHSIVWCDSYNDVARLVDRQTLREFELRVLFQMSAADSTNLLDSPAASRLRMHRGLYYSDDLGTIEKFRPYGPPSDEWLARVKAELTFRADL
jgi:energy-coupling factor transporter ATP-binding protein EcfA2